MKRRVRFSSSSRGFSKSALGLLLAALLFGTATAAPQGRPGRSPNRKSPYGINAHIPSTNELNAISDAGFGWIRVDFTWNFVQPKRDKFRWKALDRVVSEAEARDLHVLGVLGYTPPWASAGPDHTYPPKNVKLWKEFVRTIVGRYKGRVRHWCLWNEPNNHTFFKGTRDHFIDAVLEPGCRAAKEANPDCRIVGPDLAHLSGSDWDEWLDYLLRYAGSRFDIIGHHCYKDDSRKLLKELEGRKARIRGRTVRAILRKHGHHGKPFWLTEVGWRVQRVGESGQANYLVDMFERANEDDWIKKVFVFHLQESHYDPGYGILGEDGSPRLAYRALKQYIRRHPPPDPYTGARPRP